MFTLFGLEPSATCKVLPVKYRLFWMQTILDFSVLYGKEWLFQ